MIKLSIPAEILLKQYIVGKGKFREERRLLSELEKSGISIKNLEELSLQPSDQNLSHPDYLTLRIETAYELQSDLAKKGNPVDIKRCYSVIDKFVVEERKDDQTKASFTILESTFDYMRSPSQDPFSFVNRMKTASPWEVIAGAVVCGSLVALGVYHKTGSVTYSILAGAGGFIGGGTTAIQLDSWINNDLISYLRRFAGTDSEDTPSLMERRLEWKKQRYEHLLKLALN